MFLQRDHILRVVYAFKVVIFFKFCPCILVDLPIIFREHLFQLHLNSISLSEIFIKLALDLHLSDLRHNVWISVCWFCHVAWYWFRLARYGVLLGRL